jgi:hypothetical protein
VCPNHFPFGSTTGIIQVNGIGNGHAAIKWLEAIEARLPVTERPVLAVVMQTNSDSCELRF